MTINEGFEYIRYRRTKVLNIHDGGMVNTASVYIESLEWHVMQMYCIIQLHSHLHSNHDKLCCVWSTNKFKIICMGGMLMYSFHSHKETHNLLKKAYSNAFSWLKIYEFCIRFHWNLFLMFELTYSSICSDNALAPGDKPLSEPMVVRLLTHICVTRP